MKRILALALAVFLMTNVHAESVHPAVQVANNANVAFVSCVKAVTQAAANIESESTRVLMIDGAPEKCAKNVRAPNVQAEPSTASRGWALAHFALSSFAQYKGQALVWGGLQAMLGRSADSTDSAMNRGFDMAGQGIDAAAKSPVIVGTPGVSAVIYPQE